MHTPAEICSLSDIRHTSELLAELVASADTEMGLAPFRIARCAPVAGGA